MRLCFFPHVWRRFIRLSSYCVTQDLTFFGLFVTGRTSSVCFRSHSLTSTGGFLIDILLELLEILPRPHATQRAYLLCAWYLSTQMVADDGNDCVFQQRTVLPIEITRNCFLVMMRQYVVMRRTISRTQAVCRSRSRWEYELFTKRKVFLLFSPSR